MGGNRSEKALIVLDMINELAHPEGAAYEPTTQDVIPYIEGELNYFRDRQRPVIFCQTLPLNAAHNKEFVFNATIIQRLGPRAQEILLNKPRHNAFFKTELLSILQSLRVRKLTIVGLFSSTSVLITTLSALDHGFKVVVPETCVCSPDISAHKAALRIINAWVQPPNE